MMLPIPSALRDLAAVIPVGNKPLSAEPGDLIAVPENGDPYVVVAGSPLHDLLKALPNIAKAAEPEGKVPFKVKERKNAYNPRTLKNGPTTTIDRVLCAFVDPDTDTGSVLSTTGVHRLFPHIPSGTISSALHALKHSRMLTGHRPAGAGCTAWSLTTLGLRTASRLRAAEAKKLSTQEAKDGHDDA